MTHLQGSNNLGQRKNRVVIIVRINVWFYGRLVAAIVESKTRRFGSWRVHHRPLRRQRERKLEINNLFRRFSSAWGLFFPQKNCIFRSGGRGKGATLFLVPFRMKIVSCCRGRVLCNNFRRWIGWLDYQLRQFTWNRLESGANKKSTRVNPWHEHVR